MKRWLRPKILIPAVAVLVLLSIGSVLGGIWWAESEVEQALVSRAEARGWSLTVGEVDVSLSGDVLVTDIEATGPEGGRVEVEKLEANLPLSEAWAGKRIPDVVDLHGVDVFVTAADLQALQERESQDEDVESSGQGMPVVRFHNASFATDGGADLGVVRLVTPESLVERTTEAWEFSGKGTLELDGTYPLSFELAAVPSRSWGHLVANFEVPVTQSLEGYGTVSVRALDLAGTPKNVAGTIKQLSVTPDSRFGVDEIDIRQIDLSAERIGGAWRPSSIRVVEPRVRLRLRRLLEGPVGRRFPMLVDGAETARRFFGGPGPAFEGPGPVMASTTAPAGQLDSASADGASGGAQPGGSTAQQLLADMPGVMIEDGAVELGIWGERVLQLNGLSFDTTALQDSDERRYEFGITLRGADARIEVELPEDGDIEGFPAFSFELRGLAAADVFSLLGIEPFKQLGGDLDFDLDIDRADSGDLLVSGAVELNEIGFFHPMISELPVEGVDAGLQLNLRYDPTEDRLTLKEMKARSGPAVAYADITVDKVRTDPRIEFKLWAEELPCQAIPEAIPKGLMSTIDELVMSPGTMSPWVKGNIRVADPHSFRMRASEEFTGECAVESLSPHDVEALLSDDYTYTFTEYTTLPEGVTVGPGSDHWTPLRRMPGFIPASMYLTEDKRFYDHNGIRPSLIGRAVRLNLEKGRYVYGGSTISQQLVKNLFLTRRKTIARKLEELLIVWKMEWTLPKDRILELYINCIEFGPDVYGITQGARFYFDKRVTELTPLEAGYLASLKVSPRHGGKFYQRGFPSGGRWWNKRQKYIQTVLAENGYLAPLEVLGTYPWVLQFVYPEPGDTTDFRAKWLQKRK